MLTLHKADLKEFCVAVSAVVFSARKEKRKQPFFLGSELALRDIYLIVN